MAKRKHPELLQGTLDMMILKALTFGAAHGYGVVRRIRTMSEEILNVEEGSLYPALHRLEKRGLLEAEWKASESNRKAKYYRLTRTGRNRLKKEVEQWAVLAQAIEKVLGFEALAAPHPNP